MDNRTIIVDESMPTIGKPYFRFFIYETPNIIGEPTWWLKIL